MFRGRLPGDRHRHLSFVLDDALRTVAHLRVRSLPLLWLFLLLCVLKHTIIAVRNHIQIAGTTATDDTNVPFLVVIVGVPI